MAHCGETTAGEYLNTLCAVDIDTCWCELMALPNKGQKATFYVSQDVKEQLRQSYLILNPVALQRRINTHLEQMWAFEK